MPCLRLPCTALVSSCMPMHAVRLRAVVRPQLDQCLTMQVSFSRFDRDLTVAGRVLVKDDERMAHKLVRCACNGMCAATRAQFGLSLPAPTHLPLLPSLTGACAEAHPAHPHAGHSPAGGCYVQPHVWYVQPVCTAPCTSPCSSVWPIDWPACVHWHLHGQFASREPGNTNLQLAVLTKPY